MVKQKEEGLLERLYQVHWRKFHVAEAEGLAEVQIHVENLSLLVYGLVPQVVHVDPLVASQHVSEAALEEVDQENQMEDHLVGVLKIQERVADHVGRLLETEREDHETEVEEEGVQLEMEVHQG